MTLTQGQIAKVKVTVYTWKILFLDHYLSRVCTVIVASPWSFVMFVLSSSESVMMRGERYTNRGCLLLWIPIASPVPFGTCVNIYSSVETSLSTT